MGDLTHSFMTEDQKNADIARMAGNTTGDIETAQRQEARQKAVQNMMTPEEIKMCQMFNNDPLDYLKESGKLDISTLLSKDDIDTCAILNINPLDYYLARKFKC